MSDRYPNRDRRLSVSIALVAVRQRHRPGCGEACAGVGNAAPAASLNEPLNIHPPELFCYVVTWN